MNKIYGYDTNIYETSIGNISNSELRIYEGNVSTSTGKVVVNGVEITDIESWNKALDTFTNLEQKIEEKDKEIEKLNNIINSYENIKKELLDYIYHNEYCRFGHIDGGEADEMREIISKTDKLKKLKEGK